MPDKYNYAVVDRSVEPLLLNKVDEYECNAWCLFPAPVDEEFAQVAPYLVKVNDALQTWLQPKVTPWGFLLLSQAPVPALREHLRVLMDCMIAGTEQRLFLRYYDPRILWALLDGFDNVCLNHFLGPIHSVQTHFPHARASDFAAQLAHYRPFGYVTPRPLRLTQAQYQQVLKQCQQNLIVKVAALLGDAQDEHLWHFGEQLLEQCLDWDISLPAHIKSITELCANANITHWSMFPSRWAALLANTQHPAHFRIMTLQSEVRTSYGL